MAEVLDSNGKPFYPDLYYPRIYRDLQRVKNASDPEEIFTYPLAVKTR